MDFTIIEINSSDKIEFNSFIEIDDIIYSEDFIQKRLFTDISVYIISLSMGEIFYSLGKMYEINRFKLRYNCSTQSGLTGSPILNLMTNKVLGIHVGSEKEHNLGTYIKYIVEEFNKYYLSFNGK